MKKILLLVLVGLSIILGYSFGGENFFGRVRKSEDKAFRSSVKKPILRVALVADSHNENDLLAKALRQAQGKGINFVIGLGDYTNLGTIEELKAARAKFDESKLEYFVTAGDRDGWENREEALRRSGVGVGDAGSSNFREVFGEASRFFDREGIRFVILDNSDIYKGISDEDWQMLQGLTLQEAPQGETLSGLKGLTFVFAHKTPFHPESKHVMGEDSEQVSRQARKLMNILEENGVDGFFSGDLHFFAQFKSPGQSVRITTVGAVSSERNFQGPRFSVLTVYDDYISRSPLTRRSSDISGSAELAADMVWEVEDVEIR